jgi:mono/diheme cytochrome c family protein
MGRRRAFAAGFAVGFALCWAAVFLSAAIRAGDGAFTTVQATRGAAVYAESCAHCHLADLSGGTDDDSGPALRGARFLVRWQGRTVWDLFRTISNDMPFDKPGTLAPRAYADVLAFLLQENGMPSGRSELAGDQGRLEGIIIAR